LALLGWGICATADVLLPARSLHVRMGAASAAARRFQIAETLANDARKHQLLVDVVATEGFEDSIHKVSAGELDVALVSTGLKVPQCNNARIVAGLDLATLHILVRREC